MSAFERFEYLELGEQPTTQAVQPSTATQTAHKVREERVHAPAGRTLVVDQIIGRHGCAVGEFNCPCGLTVDSQGVLYVADSYNHRIQRITPHGDVMALGGRGTIPGRFLNPQDLAMGHDRSLYILEQGNCRIQKISLEGRLEMVIGQKGSRPGDFCHPMGMAIDHRGDIYVADTGNGRLQKLNRNGMPIFVISGNRDKQLFGPQGIDVDTEGNCFVADTFSHCIVKFDPHGREIIRFGCRGRSGGKFEEPQDLAMDPDGILYVIEMSNSRLQVFDQNHNCIASFEGSPSTGPLKAPTGIAIGLTGEIYIADTMNHRILRLVWR